MATGEEVIPVRFNLLGHAITVEFVDDLYYTHDVVGMAMYRQDKILLQRSTAQFPLTKEAQEHSFFHEMMHFLLYYGGEDQFEPDLHKREYLVDRLSGLLHQALTTAIYDQRGER